MTDTEAELMSGFDMWFKEEYPLRGMRNNDYGRKRAVAFHAWKASAMRRLSPPTQNGLSTGYLPTSNAGDATRKGAATREDAGGAQAASPPQEVTEEMVERGAKQAYMNNRAGLVEWDDIDHKHKEVWRWRANSVLRAALKASQDAISRDGEVNE